MNFITKIQRSFSAKLSFYVLSFTVILFLSIFSFFYLFASQTIKESANNEAESILEITKYKIENVFSVVKTVHRNIQWTVIENEIDPDSLFTVTRKVIENNPYISGCAIAFEPDYFKEKGYYFAPYSSRQGDEITTTQLGVAGYDYFTKEWYAKPKEINEPYWTNPYYDDGGGEMLMFTYSSPLYDKGNKFIGVLTADVSLDWLSETVNAIKPYKSSYCIMFGEEGVFIIHPHKEYIMNESIFSMAKRLDDKILKQIGEGMILGMSGMKVLSNTYKNDYKESYIYYAPLVSNQWYLAMVIPKAEVLENLYKTRTTVLLLFVLGLILLFVLCMLIVSRLTKPLKKFSVSARDIAQGNFNTQLPEIYSKDEMYELRQSFQFMQEELIRYIQELEVTTSKKERIESELRIARDIQMSMIPKTFPPFPDRKEIDLYAVLKPAKEVGGDLYDYFIENNKLYFIIGDVSGKGVPASLFMAVTRSLFRLVAPHYEDAGNIIRSMNDSVSETNEASMFVTLFIGILDLSSGMLNCCNAGHNPPILISENHGVDFMSIQSHIPFGIAKGYPYQSDTIQLDKNMTIFLYTDGLTEAEDTTKAFYSEAYLLDELRKNQINNPQKLTDKIMESISIHVNQAEQSDDLAILVIHFL